jgi:hypothetical protein
MTKVFKLTLTGQGNRLELIGALAGLTAYLSNKADEDIPTDGHFVEENLSFNFDGVTLTPGCCFGSNQGQYNLPNVVQLAVAYGFKSEFSATDLRGMTPSNLSGKFYDLLMDELSQAEQYLCTLCPEGYYFGCTENGDWGVWENESEREEPTYDWSS